MGVDSLDKFLVQLDLPTTVEGNEGFLENSQISDITSLKILNEKSKVRGQPGKNLFANLKFKRDRVIDEIEQKYKLKYDDKNNEEIIESLRKEGLVELEENDNDNDDGDDKNSFWKQAWVWIILGIVVLLIVAGVIY